MEKPGHYFDPYDALAPFYDAMSGAMLLPFGGERAVRRRALELLELRPGLKVLELGAGTGAMTRQLLEAGAEVTAVDLSEPMLSRARRKAPGASFILGDIVAFEGLGRFDRVLFSFVLHEMEEPIRQRALEVARRALKPTGLVAVLDFARPAHAPVRWALGIYLGVSEPRTARELVARGLEGELEAAGLIVARRRDLALGTARMVVAGPPPST
ncbi:MAG: class I SAM-dependent methyltransferase [Myxococcaceae bacterium]